MLIEKNVTALSVVDEQSGEQVGYVTLSSINREVSRTRSSELATK
jgi:hypothetical protein